MKSASEYDLFGLRISSAIPLPELSPVAGGREPDVTIRIGTIERAPSSAAFDIDESATFLWVPEVARYRIAGGREVLIDPVQGAPSRNVRLFLLGSAFGVLLHQRGMLPLHANAIEIGGRAFLFMGEAGAGKSTLAAWFVERRCKILCDDVSVIGFDGRAVAYVCPGLPRLRLWNDALERLGRDASRYERSYITESGRGEKFEIPIEAAAVSRREIPVAGIYLLSRGDRPAIDELGPVEAFEAVFANTYRGSCVSMLGQQVQHWTSAVRLVQSVPIYRAARRWSLAELDEQCAVLLEHAKGEVADADGLS